MRSDGTKSSNLGYMKGGACISSTHSQDSIAGVCRRDEKKKSIRSRYDVCSLPTPSSWRKLASKMSASMFKKFMSYIQPTEFIGSTIAIDSHSLEVKREIASGWFRAIRKT